MKKILLITLFLSGMLFAQSPLQKGTYNLKGNVSLSSYWYEESETEFEVNLSPGGAYFVADRFSIGINLSAVYSRDDYFTSTQFGIGPELRYYFTGMEKLYPFITAGFTYSEHNYKFNDDDEFTFLSGNNTVNFGGGLIRMITESVAVEATVQYRRRYENNSGANWGTLVVGFGLNYFIR